MNRPGDWNCMSCHHLNFQRRESCHRCGESRLMGERLDYGLFGGRTPTNNTNNTNNNFSPFGFSTGPDVRPGDWYCGVGNCGAHNFANRSSCFKCGALKEELSGGGFDSARGFGFGGNGGGSRSGWKSGDWSCSRPGCNEHNFASRVECFRCSAPREY